MIESAKKVVLLLKNDFLIIILHYFVAKTKRTPNIWCSFFNLKLNLFHN